MKKVLVLAVMIATLFAATAFAGPMVGLRTWPGATLIPSLGVEYKGVISPWIELYKPDFWSFAWPGTYVVEGGVAVPFVLNDVQLWVPIGGLIAADIATSPFSISLGDAAGVLGLWWTGLYSTTLKVECYYTGSAFWLSGGVHIDLHSLWDALFVPPVQSG